MTSETLKWIERAQMIYVSMALHPSLQLMKQTVNVFATHLKSEIETRDQDREKGLLRIVEDLLETLREEETYASEIAVALLRIVKSIIELEVTKCISPSGTGLLSVYVNRDDLIDSGLRKEYQLAIQLSESAYISLEDVQALAEMTPSRAKLLPFQKHSISISSLDETIPFSRSHPHVATNITDETFSNLRSPDERSSNLKRPLRFSKSAVGLFEMFETCNDPPTCEYLIESEKLTLGSRYVIGPYILTIADMDLMIPSLAGRFFQISRPDDPPIEMLVNEVPTTPFTIGRALSNSLVLFDPSVSRLHAEISWENFTWIIRNRVKKGLWKQLHREYTKGVCESPRVRLRGRVEVRVCGKSFILDPGSLVLLGKEEGE